MLTMPFYKFHKYILSVLLLSGLFFMGCKTSRNLKVKQQYEYYSNLYGVQLKGSEDLRLLEVAEPWLGVPYKLGGTTKKGVDCSAFIGHVFKEGFNITLPRRSSDIALHVKKIHKKNIQYGDLLFFAIKNKKVSHIAIYLGENKFLHASTSKGVAVAVLNERYWRKYWVSSGRVLNLMDKQSAYKPQENHKPTPPKKSEKPKAPSRKKRVEIISASPEDEEENLQYIIPEI